MATSKKTKSSAAILARLGDVAKLRGISLHVAKALNQSRGLAVETLGSMPESLLRRAIRRLQYPDLPRQRAMFRLLHLQSDTTEGALSQYGRTSRRIRAIHQQDSLRLRSTVATVAGVPVGPLVSPSSLSPIAQPGPGGIDPRSWLALGPGNIGGRTRCIVPDPDQQNRLWLGSAGGGVWRSDNAGASWIPVDDLMANLAVCALALSPVRDAAGRRLMLAGTGEGFDNIDAIQGAGIFASYDGSRWQLLASTNTVDFPQVNRIAVSSDGATVLAATPTGLMRSSTPQLSAWTKTLTTAVGDVRFHPANPLLAVAGGLSDGNAYFSIDGGVTWKPSTHSTPWGGRVEMTFAAANPSTVYASVNMNGGTIWRSTNGGKSFTQMNSATRQGQPTNYLGDQGWYANTIWAGDPKDANAVIVGGLDLWRSADGGATLDQISLWSVDNSVHADHHCIVSDPGMGRARAARKVYFGNDGGIFCTNDYVTAGNDANHTAGWIRLDNGYGVTQFYGAAGNAQSGNIIGGAQDNGTVLYTQAGGNNGWTTTFGGDGGQCAADSTDPNYFYGEYVYCQIVRSSDGGRTGDYICGQYYDSQQQNWFWKPAPYSIPDAKCQNALFIAPFVLDPNKADRILAGGMSLWRTDDAKTPNDDTALTGPSWIEIKTSISAEISAIAVNPGNSDIVWVGHIGGQIFVTSNATSGQPQWRQVAGGMAFPLSLSRYCSAFHITANAPDEVYVSYAAYQNGVAGSNLWRTRDGGQTWSDLGQALPDAPVHSITRHPQTAGYLYAGTEIGLFASDDDGMNWAPTNEGPTNSPVYSLSWMNNNLVCATHGRGMWRIAL